MSDKNSRAHGLNEIEALSARWDKVAFYAQGSPFEDVSIAALAKNSGMRAWSRSGNRVKADTTARYIYLSFEELIEIEKLDLKTAELLLEVLETTFLFENECDDIGSFEEIDNQAYAQRMRFVEEYGLYQDFPVQLANLDSDLRDLCRSEEIITFIDLMEFLDRLSDKAWIGGSYKNLQNVFAHGDESGLTKYFPYRMNHRGFHFPESLAFILNRISRKERQEIFDYYEFRRRRARIRSNKVLEFPAVIESSVIPELFECLSYFAKRQPRLLTRLFDSAYIIRELMFLSDPQSERVLHWLIRISLSLFQLEDATGSEADDQLESISLSADNNHLKELRLLLHEDREQCP